MDAYIFQADVWCGPCIKKVLAENSFIAPYDPTDPADHDPTPSEALDRAREVKGYKKESDYDSDELPKGPFDDGGGEADTPQHCCGCQLFLENPLTQAGYRYVRELILEHADTGRGDRAVLLTWAAFYEVGFAEKISDFTRGYIKCALFDADETPGPGEWSKFDEFFSDLSLDALQQLAIDATAFVGQNGEDIDEAVDNGRINGYTEVRAGVDFWWTRNGAGVSFQDRDLGDVGDKLTKAAQACSECRLYRGDDGLFYLGEG